MIEVKPHISVKRHGMVVKDVPSERLNSSTGPAAAGHRGTFKRGCEGGGSPSRGRLGQGRVRGSDPRRVVFYALISAAALGALASLFVGSEVIEQHLFPGMSMGWHHALLTARAALVTGVAGLVVYLVMRRQQVQLSSTAEQLTYLLESYQANPTTPERFENPHLVYCRDVLDCHRTDCPMYDSPGERCWQVMALNHTGRDNRAPLIDIQQCHECAVYRLSCPDKLTELGESFNNLLYLLEAEAQQVGRMRGQMLEKEKMVAIGQIASGIAHEVGNPLSSISSIVQMLQRDRSGAPTGGQLELIQTHITRISTIVRQMVSLARPAVEKWERMDIGQALEEAVRLVGFDRRAKRVEIDFERPASLPPTYGLPAQLQQVFINLSLNALDAMPDGGKLTIRIQRRRKHIVVRVKDTGMGIPEAVNRRIFEPFFTTKQPGHGTGLGLAVSYGIVQKHGGTIDFDSTVGEGTTFTIELPILAKAPHA